VLSGDEHVAEFQAPANVVRLEAGKTLQDALVAGDLAATIGVQMTHPDVAPLIPDAEEAGFRALARDGHYPINHLLVVKDSVLAAHPQLAERLLEAFTEAKRPYLERLRAPAAGEPTKADHMYRRVLDITDRDPLPYGIEPNRQMLAALLRYAREQQIVSRPFEVEELFARGNP
jgi:4,5-dihydroxyphthalate decarboxylase